MTEPKDNIGRFIIATIAYQTGNDSWVDEFQAWYKPKKWFHSRRAACAFVAEKICELQEQIKKNEKEKNYVPKN